MDERLEYLLLPRMAYVQELATYERGRELRRILFNSIHECIAIPDDIGFDSRVFSIHRFHLSFSSN